MYSRQPTNPYGGHLPPGGPPVDILAILGVVFFTFSLQFFQLTSVIPAILRLTPRAWQSGYLWQVATYPFVGIGSPDFWFILELYILFMFSRDVFSRLGRRNFWKLMVWACIPPAVVALIVDLIGRLLLQQTFGPKPLILMQGQFMLGAIMITAFASLNRNATIRLMFVLPIRALYFVPLTLVFAFLGFLTSKDLAGFVGLCLGVGLTYSYLTPGGLRRFSRETSLRLQQAWYRRKMDKLRSRRGFTIVKGDDDPPN